MNNQTKNPALPFLTQNQTFVAPGLQKIPTSSESRHQMVLVVTGSSKSSNKTVEQTGISTTTGQPCVAPMDEASLSIIYVPHEKTVRYIPPSDRSLQETVDGCKEDYKPNSPSQTHSQVFTCSNAIQALYVDLLLFREQTTLKVS